MMRSDDGVGGVGARVQAARPRRTIRFGCRELRRGTRYAQGTHRRPAWPCSAPLHGRTACRVAGPGMQPGQPNLDSTYDVPTIVRLMLPHEAIRPNECFSRAPT